MKDHYEYITNKKEIELIYIKEKDRVKSFKSIKNFMNNLNKIYGTTDKILENENKELKY